MLLFEIRDNIAQHFNKSFDIPFKSRVHSEIILARAEIIKQHFNKYGTYPESLVSQINTIAMQGVDIAESSTITLGENIKKSLLAVPSPIRMSKRNSNFIYVGTIDGKRSFGYIEPENLNDILADRFSKNTIRYTYINGYIYIFGSCPKNIRVRGIFADPYKVAVLNGEVEEDCPQSLELPEDFGNLVEKMVIDMIQRSSFDNSNEEVKIQENDK